MMTEEFRGSDVSKIQLKSSTRDKEIKNYLTNTTKDNPSSFRAHIEHPTLGLEEINSVEEIEQPKEDVNLDKLYDLETSRFEEEFDKMPSSKKKMILD
jgi:hypothetical protein